MDSCRCQLPCSLAGLVSICFDIRAKQTTVTTPPHGLSSRAAPGSEFCLNQNQFHHHSAAGQCSGPVPRAPTARSCVQPGSPAACAFPQVKSLPSLRLCTCLWEPGERCQSLFHCWEMIFWHYTKPCKNPLP